MSQKTCPWCRGYKFVTDVVRMTPCSNCARGLEPDSEIVGVVIVKPCRVCCGTGKVSPKKYADLTEPLRIPVPSPAYGVAPG